MRLVYWFYDDKQNSANCANTYNELHRINLYNHNLWWVPYEDINYLLVWRYTIYTETYDDRRHIICELFNTNTYQNKFSDNDYTFSKQRCNY